jgi:hypothetical protein
LTLALALAYHPNGKANANANAIFNYSFSVSFGSAEAISHRITTFLTLPSFILMMLMPFWSSWRTLPSMP